MTTIADILAEHRFELAAEGELAAVYYRREGYSVVRPHTQVPDEHANHGPGKAFATDPFELTRRSGKRVQVRRDVTGRIVAQHPEYCAHLCPRMARHSE